MTATILANAFSANMLPTGSANVTFTPISVKEARALAAGSVSTVGHAETAAVFAAVLGVPVPMNRITVTLLPGSTMLLGQYSGPRLPEGATTLPEGAEIRWMRVEVTARAEADIGPVLGAWDAYAARIHAHYQGTGIDPWITPEARERVRALAAQTATMNDAEFFAWARQATYFIGFNDGCGQWAAEHTTVLEYEATRRWGAPPAPVS